jgi:hypothetical protein
VATNDPATAHFTAIKTWETQVSHTNTPSSESYKKENVEKPPRNSAGFCGGGQGLNWAVEPRKEEEEEEEESSGVNRYHFHNHPFCLVTMAN